tara:strand:- start:1650 stop:2171 length:522 start_codon:yes stop_codon:yes gene_type:complete
MANDMFNQDAADDNQQSMDNMDPSNPSPAPSPLPMENKINPTSNPYSNGTGSARPVFNQASQDAIGKINQGQQMGNMMLNNPQQGQLMNGASMDDGDNGYTYTTSESKASRKQKRKEARKERVTVRKTKVKKEYKNSSSAFLPSDAFKTKTKEVKPKRAARMAKRGFREAIKG